MPVYTGNVNIAGYNYNIAASTFSNNVYNYQQTQLAQALTLKSAPDGDFVWELLASEYNYLNDKQRVPTAALPAAFTGGAGQVNRMNGTGWYTLDAEGVWRGWTDHELSFGAHRDAETFAQLRNNLTDWIAGGLGTVANPRKAAPPPTRCGCRTSGPSLPDLKLTLGGRYEDWRAYDGTNFSASPALNVIQPRCRPAASRPRRHWPGSHRTLVADRLLGRGLSGCPR